MSISNIHPTWVSCIISSERHLRPLKTTSMPPGFASHSTSHAHDKGTQRDSSPGRQLSPSSRSLFSCQTMPAHSRYSSSNTNTASACDSDHTVQRRSSFGNSSGTHPLSSFSSDHASTHTVTYPATPHSTWWTKMDSGRMNDEHISELHSEEPSLSHRLQHGGEHVHSVSEQIVEIVRGLHPPTISEAGPSSFS